MGNVFASSLLNCKLFSDFLWDHEVDIAGARIEFDLSIRSVLLFGLRTVRQSLIVVKLEAHAIWPSWNVEEVRFDYAITTA